MNKDNLTSKQKNVLRLLSEKPMTRMELKLLKVESPRRDLRVLERLGLVVHKEKYLNNQIDAMLKRLPGTRYFEYSLAK
ncbi:MAG TPA: hypothetical protein VFC79_07135 [Tissierellaceae bacterium]|nr:hypothetical protein [Tissierellaceae bacterium]